MTVIGDGKIEQVEQVEKVEEVTTTETTTATTQPTQPTTEEETPKKKENVFDDVKKESKIEAPGDSVTADVVEKASSVESPESNVYKTINREQYRAEELVITPKEKQAFLDSLVTGGRYTQAYDIFGGRVHVVVRNRTTDETNAMYAYVRYALSRPGNTAASVDSQLPFVPLVAQIEEINGVKYPEMKAPYTFVEDKGVTTEPGWYEDFLAWVKKPEGLTSALVNRIQLFEYKYWTMVKEASNADFWKTDTSTVQ